MSVQYYTATSVDGYIADADNSLDWLFQFGDGDDDTYQSFIAEVGALVMGATTYQWVLQNHIQAGADRPQPWPYRQPCWVFTHRELPAVEGADIRFAQGDPATAYAEMIKVADGRNIWLVGGGDLVGQFHDHGLLDEIILGVAPVTLGAGAPVLPRRISDPPMRLTEVRQIGEFAYLTYQVRSAAS